MQSSGSNFSDAQTDSFSIPARVAISWFPGRERKYRFSRKDGKIHIDLSSQSREVGFSLDALILQYYSFPANLFRMGHQSWVQLAFLDPSNAVSIAYLSSGATNGLAPWTDYILDLEYQNMSLASVVTNISFVQRFSKSTGNTFYVYKFSGRQRATEAEQQQYELAKEFVQREKPIIIDRRLDPTIAIPLFAQSQGVTVDALVVEESSSDFE